MEKKVIMFLRCLKRFKSFVTKMQLFYDPILCVVPKLQFTIQPNLYQAAFEIVMHWFEYTGGPHIHRYHLCCFEVRDLPYKEFCYSPHQLQLASCGVDSRPDSRYCTGGIISCNLRIFTPFFSAVYNQEWLILQTIYVQNKEI